MNRDIELLDRAIGLLWRVHGTLDNERVGKSERQLAGMIMKDAIEALEGIRDLQRARGDAHAD